LSGYIRWLGHSAFEIYLAGNVILVDPWISNPLSPVSVGEYRGRVDLIVVTHDHMDHVGDTLELLKINPGARLVAVYELANHIGEQLGDPGRVVGANIGGPVRVEGVNTTILFFPATHSSTRGVATSVLLSDGKTSVFHAGDTGLFSEMELIGELYGVDIALVPIGGHFTMDALQAAKAVQMLKAKVAIPMHYNTFPLISANPDDFERKVKQLSPSTRVIVLKPGEKYEF